MFASFSLVTFIFAIVLPLFVVILVFFAGILLFFTRVFKAGITFKNAFKITILHNLIIITAQSIPMIILWLGKGERFLAWMVLFMNFMLVAVGGFFVFQFLFRRYQQASWQKILGLYACLFAVALVCNLILAPVIRTFVVAPFYVSGKSMEPTLQDKNYVLVKKYARVFSHGDIVVYKSPRDPREFLVHRVAGVPFDEITLTEGKIIVAGKEYASPYKGETKNVKLKSGEYFMLGDNATASMDSRYFGPISGEQIVGKVFVRIEW